MSSSSIFIIVITFMGMIIFYGAYDCQISMDLRTAVNGYVQGLSKSSRKPTKVNVSLAYKQLDLREETAICPRLFRAGKVAINEALQNHSTYTPIPEEIFTMMASDCLQYRHERSYITSSITKEEKEFPIAFSILFYKDFDQFERLLRAIYRPQNVYCLHVDQKSSLSIHEATSAIAGCFDNVFVVPNPNSVEWGTLSVLEAEKSCMSLLWRKDKKWKYLINLTGQEFPLKTNAEIVKILKAYGGANDIEFHYGKYNHFKTRTSFKCQGEDHAGGSVPKIKIQLSQPPHGIKLAVGSTHIAVTREYINYLLHNQTAIDFFYWIKDTCIPDETFFNSLYINPQLGVPGAYTGDPEIYDVLNIHFVRYKKWNWKSRPCKGREVRGVCIQNIYYLPELRHAPEMFVNKFNIDYHPMALRCMEELLYSRVKAEVLGHPRQFDVSRYRSAHFVVKASHVNRTDLRAFTEKKKARKILWT